MVLMVAQEKDLAEVVELADWAYRKTGDGSSWNSETGLIEGSRLTEDLLREDLAAKPEALLLLHRDEANGELLGTVWLEPKGADVWYLGLLMVRPGRQSGGLGNRLLAAAEALLREKGARSIWMTVLWVRAELLAWYERKGFRLTGERAPFPYGDERFGRPLRDDFYFVVMEKAMEA